MTFYMTYIFTVKFDILKINTKIENVLRPGEGEFPLSAPLTTPLVVKQIGWFDSNLWPTYDRNLMSPSRKKSRWPPENWPRDNVCVEKHVLTTGWPNFTIFCSNYFLKIFFLRSFLIIIIRAIIKMTSNIYKTQIKPTFVMYKIKYVSHVLLYLFLTLKFIN